jgi:hypothetical protein
MLAVSISTAEGTKFHYDDDVSEETWQVIRQQYSLGNASAPALCGHSGTIFASWRRSTRSLCLLGPSRAGTPSRHRHRQRHCTLFTSVEEEKSAGTQDVSQSSIVRRTPAATRLALVHDVDTSIKAHLTIRMLIPTCRYN